MGRREAEEARQGAATLVQQAWSGGYKRACEVGGAIFVPMALTPYGGWHQEDKDFAESWTRKTTHTGDWEASSPHSQGTANTAPRF